ncbi:TetR/AcrR family transcriptional regulator [Pseudoflavonifractor phocaeensis]|uniref:TetR/AcrR family transcriptional regulator n=1 Tax=Pseudoflavonifractor phocaeensis TaxID=1870988 RepID=UPI00195A3295|nr:TetR/AcrR family transcriptional regulator [Pseudoflavonifractor phocaeensis]MBM6939021.1 TetR/AcrR family transcriptional regulator [Pseudoflavonifractor phocaeensis]
MDLRIEKTRRSIAQAFLALRAQKPLEKITVKELCQRAMINKSTFYDHYTDLYALSDALEEAAVADILARLPHPEYVFQRPAAFIRDLTLGHLAHQEQIRVLFSGSRQGHFISRLKAGLEELVWREHPEYRDDPVKRVLVSFQIYGGYYAYLDNKDAVDPARLWDVLGAVSQEIQRLDVS